MKIYFEIENKCIDIKKVIYGGCVENAASLKGNEFTRGGSSPSFSPDVIAWNQYSSVDPTIFNHDLFSGDLTVLKDGDYLVTATVPLSNYKEERATYRTNLLVNGISNSTAIGESSYIRNNVGVDGHNESSNHFAVLVSLKANDIINITTMITTTYGLLGSIMTCSLYVELVEDNRDVFSATATEIQSGTNLNVEPDTGNQGLVWTSTRKGSGFSHKKGEAQITIKNGGNYMVYANVPLNGFVERGSVGMTLNLDDKDIEGARGQQGYIRNIYGHQDSSIHFSGMIRAEAGQVLTITTEKFANAGTIQVQENMAASIFIEKVDNGGLFSVSFFETTVDENMNPKNKTSLFLEVWDGFSDESYYSNEGESGENIVIKKEGNYLLSFNSTFTSGYTRANPQITVEVNNVVVSGATSLSHYIRNSDSHNESSGSFVVLLSNLLVDDIITISTKKEGNGGIVTSPEGGKITLQAKAAYTPAAQDTHPPKMASLVSKGLDGFEATLEDFGLSVDAASINAIVNGAEVDITTSKVGSITTVNYKFASIPDPYSTHTVTLNFSDSAGNSQSKEFQFTVNVDYKLLPASFASTSVDKSSRGFIANVTQISSIQTEGPTYVHGGKIDGAEKQLAGLYLNPNDLDDDDNPKPYFNEADPDDWDGWSIAPIEVDGVINWNQDEGAAIGNFGEDQEIPQIPGWGDSSDGIVAEILGYLELSKGIHTLGVNSDDGFKVSFGPNSKDIMGIIAGDFNGMRGAADSIFKIAVEEAGLYPVRLLWFEASGGASLEFFSVDENGDKILINDLNNEKAIKSYKKAVTSPYISRVVPSQGEFSKTIEFDLINGDLIVDINSVKIKLNGVNVSISTSSINDGISVIYDHGDYFLSGNYSVELSYTESGGTERVRNYSFTIPKGRIDILIDNPKVTIEFDDLTGNKAVGAIGKPDAEYINEPELGVNRLYPNSVGTAVRFDGSKDQALHLSDHIDINMHNQAPSEERTLEFWFKAEKLPEKGNFAILFQEGKTSRGISIYLYGTENDAEPNLYMMAWNRDSPIWGGVLNQVGDEGITAIKTRVDVNQIYHLVFVMDGDLEGNLEGTLTGYLNGNQVGQVSGVGALYYHYSISFGNLYDDSVNHTGDSLGTGGMGFTGILQDACFYNKALSAERVESHFQTGFNDNQEQKLPKVNIIRNNDGTVTFNSEDKLQFSSSVLGPWIDNENNSQLIITSNQDALFARAIKK